MVMDGGDDIEDLVICCLLLYSPPVIHPIAFVPDGDITLKIPVKGVECSYIKYSGGVSITAWEWYEEVQSMD
jgi:hypothetical protein